MKCIVIFLAPPRYYGFYTIECLKNKTLSKALDPQSTDAWLSKLTECNMKYYLRRAELIGRARRDGREARGTEEREKRED